MKDLVRYHFKQYFKTNKPIIPFTVLLASLYLLYATKPIEIVDSIMSACVFVFLITSWIGVTACNLENEVSEQIIILRIKSSKKYYYSHIFFLFYLSMLIALVAIAVPIILNALDGNHLFDKMAMVSDAAAKVTERDFGIPDILCAFALLTATAFMGCSVGEISHPRVIKNRNIGILLIFLVDALSIAQVSLIEVLPAARLVLWMLPPVTKMLHFFSNEEYFPVLKVIVSVTILLIYSGILSFIKVKILDNKKF